MGRFVSSAVLACCVALTPAFAAAEERPSGAEAEAAKHKKKKKRKKRRASSTAPAAPVAPTGPTTYKLSYGDAIAAIEARLQQEAANARATAGDGYPWTYGYRGCAFKSEIEMGCTAYLIKIDPDRCAFMGYPGRQYTADEWFIGAFLRNVYSPQVSTAMYLGANQYVCYA